MSVRAHDQVEDTLKGGPGLERIRFWPGLADSRSASFLRTLSVAIERIASRFDLIDARTCTTSVDALEIDNEVCRPASSSTSSSIG